MSRRLVIPAAVLLALSLVCVTTGCARLQETLFSEAPMEAYLAETITLDEHFGSQTLPPSAAASSRGWVAVVEVLGAKPQAPKGCDVYVRYYAGVPTTGGDAAATAEAGYAVAHVEDPDEPSGPVSFRFPGDGSQWKRDMQSLMPRRYWQGAKPAELEELKGAWLARVREDVRP